MVQKRSWVIRESVLSFEDVIGRNPEIVSDTWDEVCCRVLVSTEWNDCSLVYPSASVSTILLKVVTEDR
jgi:hypothetical protein